MTNTDIIKRLTKLHSPIDPKVALELKHPEPDAHQWAQLQFNQYCFEPLNTIVTTENRTRAILHLMGKAAALLTKHDPKGEMFTMRTFYRTEDSRLVPRLYIAERPIAPTPQAIIG